MNFTAVGLEGVHAHQAVNEIRDAAQRGFQFFRRFAGDPRAETARRHIDKAGSFIHLRNVDSGRFPEDSQLQRFA